MMKDVKSEIGERYDIVKHFSNEVFPVYIWRTEDKMAYDMEKEELLYHMYQQDLPQKNHQYIDEERIVNLVREGDEVYLKENIDEIWPTCSRIVPESIKKSEEYLAVITIALVSRAAIEGGMTSQESFRLSDLYLREIAHKTTMKEIRNTRNQAVIEYARRVRKIKEEGSEKIVVENAKSFITVNIFKKISLRDVAKALGMNKSYVGRVFRESEGMTVVRYIQREKVKMAENMLKYSDRTVVEIADYIQFVNQSYFGKIFKRETGLSPVIYRNKYHPPQF